MNLDEYLAKYSAAINQASETLFVEEFLYPLLGANIEQIIPQYPFIDGTGKNRRIDFAYVNGSAKLALEVNGETYHAEGIIPDNNFDDNLFRQNEILMQGYKLLRYSYNQLKSPQWRPIIQRTLRDFFARYAQNLLSEYTLQPTSLQREALEAIHFYRQQRNWRRGVVVLPTGTGKTVLSALDAKEHGGRILFLVHRLDILQQSIEAYKTVWGKLDYGILTGESKENMLECEVLFASKDTLRQPEYLQLFDRNWFNYIVVDEVHHGQSPTYKDVLQYFQPNFMLGMTATPDRADRKDIFELFDYQKLYELPLTEAITQGYLVPYTYYGLQDNVDYSRIRYQNNRYRVDDLERLLIIPERNKAIIDKYLEIGGGDKAIGFCVSIRHAERMAEVFQGAGIPAEAIHSQKPNREQLIQDFRDNKLHVVFTVDLFNEGVDFPNLRVLLFLRPTESKTVFLQQLGRGLRLHVGKDRIIILDFIGNYQRANQIRQFLATEKNEIRTADKGKKFEYVYSTGCEVIFDEEVEELLNAQDAQEFSITKDDLIESYYALAERLKYKPSRDDIDKHNQYKSALYARLFGSWVNFLRHIGEYTEASFHYPQGTSLGHILSILKYFGGTSRANTHFDDIYIRLRGNLSEGRVGTYQRQVKYKLQAAMELGILTDDRKYANDDNHEISFTPLGLRLRQTLEPILDRLDLKFQENNGVPSSNLPLDDREYNSAVRTYIQENPVAKRIVYEVFLKMPAVEQMMAFLYHIARQSQITRAVIYQQFFETPFVKQFCDREGIEPATEESAKHRLPFLLNILDACGIVQSERSYIIVKKLVLTPYLVAPHHHEDIKESESRLENLDKYLSGQPAALSSEDISILRELFGKDFLSENYFLKDIEIREA